MNSPIYDVVIQMRDAAPLRHPLADGESTIGRSSSNAIVIKHPSVSREHARVTVGAGGVVFENITDAEGTLHGGLPVSGARAWVPGETIQIGEVSVTLEESCADAGGAPTMENSRSALAYEEGQEIARGGMGAIFSVRDPAARRVIALKRILGDVDDRAKLRFIDEAQITAQLEHPNIVPVHEVATGPDGKPYYTMKLVKGITLKKIIELLAKGSDGTIAKYPLPVLLTIFQKVCDAIAFAHSRGIIHRDLKPANIMVGEFGGVLVMDWGLAKKIGPSADAAPAPSGKDAARIFAKVWAPEVSSIRNDASSVSFQTQDGAVIGTPHYMAPEQAAGRIAELDARTDIFALGGILCHLLVLQHPFPGTNLNEIITAILSGDFIPPAQRAKATAAVGEKPAGSARFALPPLRHLPACEVPGSLDAICRKALAHEPAARYQGVAELQVDLALFQGGFATGAENASAWTQLKLLVKRNKAASLGLAAVLVVGSTLGTKAIMEGRRAEREAVTAKAALADLKKTAPALRQLAESEAGLQRFDSALEKLDAALALDPSHLPDYWRRAWLFIGMDRLPEAVVAIRLAQEKDPANRGLATIAPVVETLAALPAGEPWPQDSARHLWDHLDKVDASAEVVALSTKLKLSANENETLVRKRLEQWLGKGKGKVDLDKTGRVRVDFQKLPIGTADPLLGLPIDDLDISYTRIATVDKISEMKLIRLSIQSTKIANLSPVRGMLLREILLDRTEISDLSPLSEAPLEVMSCSELYGIDLSPLRRAPLRVVNISRTSTVDLSFLSAAPIEDLQAYSNQISDLTPLQGKQLKVLSISSNKVRDLSPLRGCPIVMLVVHGNPLKDLTPLLDLPKLERLRISKLGKLLEPLRQHPSLKLIAYDDETYRPVAKFWAEYDADNATK